MINPFTALKAASAGKKIAIGLAAVIAIFVIIKSIQYFIDQNNVAQRKVGTLETINTANQGVIENVKNANQAVNDLRDNPDAVYDECLRASRTPENCVRQ